MMTEKGRLCSFSSTSNPVQEEIGKTTQQSNKIYILCPSSLFHLHPHEHHHARPRTPALPTSACTSGTGSGRLPEIQCQYIIHKYRCIYIAHCTSTSSSSAIGRRWLCFPDRVSCLILMGKFNKAGINMGHIDQPSDIGRLTSVWKLILLSTGLSYCLCIDVWRKTKAEWKTQTIITNNSPFILWIAKNSCLLLLVP